MAYHPFRHFGLKVLSILIAVALWLLVSGEHLVERSLRVPCEFQNIPEGLEMVGDLPSVVDVRVRGPSGDLSRLEPGDLAAVLDLGSAKPGRRLFHVTPDNVRAPFGIEATQVTPSTVFMTFERSGSREVPIVPSVEGEPAPGYEVGKISSEPSKVEIVGPVSRLRQVTHAITEPISVDGAARPIREAVTIGVPDPSVRLGSPGRATVTVDVSKAPIELRLPNVAVHLRDLQPALSAQSVPAVVTAIVRGPKTLLDRLRADSVSAFVDVSGLGPGRYTLRVRAMGESSVSIVRTEPAEVEVRIKQ